MDEYQKEVLEKISESEGKLVLVQYFNQDEFAYLREGVLSISSTDANEFVEEHFSLYLREPSSIRPSIPVWAGKKDSDLARVASKERILFEDLEKVAKWNKSFNQHWLRSMARTNGAYEFKRLLEDYNLPHFNAQR